RIANLVGVVVPFVGVIVAIGLLWNRAVDGVDLALLGAMYLLTALGITVGFHRLLTHRAFQTYPWLERTFAVLGSLSVQGSVMDWVADHRKHHAHADKEGDPHSPHVGHGSGLRGLWHAHTGWLLETQGQADCRRFEIEDRSTNVAWLSLLSLGESWHHNHHAFPRSAYHGLRWWEIDPSGLLISMLERLGLAWNVVRITPDRQLQKTSVHIHAH